MMSALYQMMGRGGAFRSRKIMAPTRFSSHFQPLVSRVKRESPMPLAFSSQNFGQHLTTHTRASGNVAKIPVPNVAQKLPFICHDKSIRILSKRVMNNESSSELMAVTMFSSS